MVLQEVGGKEYVLSSLGLVFGDQERKIVDTIGEDGVFKSPPSSIRTNFSLEYDAVPEVEATISEASEYEVGELTRLCNFFQQCQPRNG